ncbi:hypothetical protein A946_09925 [Methylacidiphilum kamchatkense Kam1]|uniref:Uncharacterized protein n=1 Tax=Methylacidiphilum kamchatkense Kam1 TaxID=1202785 RepID=A0A0C1UMZ0_9BACT|nr:hypothetical protein A946_09925 [Methylacidiphilum kamchatkense Kam1]QDQ42391.1 hypothetical protein kam1_1163 [Methylacidiphilum kamchatkense Kam1]
MKPFSFEYVSFKNIQESLPLYQPGLHILDHLRNLKAITLTKDQNIPKEQKESTKSFQMPISFPEKIKRSIER